MKTYLSYAQTGKLDIPVPTGRDADSPFEEAVANSLREVGFRIEHQVGVGGFFIDLAVVDEQRSGRYILGIECDGATYHSARSARDRDRLRQQVLEGMGWRIHRIWSTDWFKRPDNELRRTIEAIEKAKVQDVPVDPPASSPGCFSIEREEQASVEDNSLSERYQMADLRISLRGYELHEVPRSTLTDWIEEIVQVESPIHFNELVNRVREAAGLRRAGNRIRNALEVAVERAVYSENIRRKHDFIWRRDQEKPKIRDRSDLPSASRKIELIAPEEIELAIKTVVQNAMGMVLENIPQAACRLFGFRAVREDTYQHISQIVTSMVHKGELVQQGDSLVVSD